MATAKLVKNTGKINLFFLKQLHTAHNFQKELYLKLFSPIQTTSDTYFDTYQAVMAHNCCTVPPSSKCVRLKNL